MSSPLRFLAPVALVFAALAGCDTPGGGADECSADVDCGAAKVCVAAQCVECASNTDCADGSFCCQGICRADAEVETRCGCGPSPTASAGQACNPNSIDSGLCLVGDAVATPDNVAQGSCGCACTPALGGPICGAPPAAGEAPVCSCAENADCRQASVDAASQLHRVADTCTPDSSCVCFSLGTADACDPDGATPDCASSGGCLSLDDDAQNCGKPARSCTAAATGILDTGSCLGGGCSCDDAGDCAADGLNVNSCAFPVAGEPARCVCNAFTVSGVVAPCPMELVCAAGGCLLDGAAFATDAALRGALGIR